VTGAGAPFLWLCGPSGVGKSSVGWQIFSQVRRSGIKAGYLDFDQVGPLLSTSGGRPGTTTA
jgi:adenylylsulfate kinase-like enzyme